MNERKIIIALITSPEYLQAIRPLWDGKFIESNAAKKIGQWCIEYYDKYGTAPGHHIADIFYEKVRDNTLSTEEGEEIEDDILPGLSEEHKQDEVNYALLIDQTKKHFKSIALQRHHALIEELVEEGKVDEAEKIAQSYSTAVVEYGDEVDLGSKQALTAIRKAFAKAADPIVTFPGALGELWDEHFIRGGLVSLMGPEKRGKTFWLLEIAIRASREGKKVAFFQAGDMTEDEQMMRIAIYQARKSNKEKYCGIVAKPVRDCVLNQFDECDKDIRECDFGVFTESDKTEFHPSIRDTITLEVLLEKQKEFPDYRPCHNCLKYRENPWATPWIELVNVGNPMEVEEAEHYIEKYFVNQKRRMRLSSHVNDTLTTQHINSILDTWARRDKFIPDLIVVDYADLLVPTVREFRHGVDSVWKNLRAMSQKRDALVVTATQADANSYDQGRLKLKNFSEDKRKYSHVTAMYGLNQDPHGREADVGIMRINQITVRGGEKNRRDVYVLSSLKTGQPFLTSYW